MGLDSAYGLLLGTRSDLLRTLDVATVAALVDAPDAILALARLSAEEAEQDGDADRRAGLRLRSVALAIGALRRDKADRAGREFLVGIVPLVDQYALTRDQRAFLENPEHIAGRRRRQGPLGTRRRPPKKRA